ncbi:hypothetical protein GCM10023346_11850 [Arthrobacter gyeryongensis]|uniref:Uncharacterized protein n=1 Tax=Arthrobacter gyeryongensis TaxID=1650592 RepID=A0ABP9S8I4_9MICC
MEDSKGPDEKVWISRFGKAGLMTIILMFINNSWWTGRNVIREALTVALAFALSLAFVALSDFASRWLKSRRRR